MSNRTKKQIANFSITIFLLMIITASFQSCENNPNDAGLTFLRPGDTTGILFLDSQLDTMPITNNNYKFLINTSISQNILVGLYQNYISKSLLQFTNIDPNLDSATVLSAVLTLKYSNYFFQDNMGLTGFDLYKVKSNYNYTTVTFDSVTPSGIGTISLGNYSGIVADSQSINITISNQEVKDWFEYAADTGYVNKNYGLILMPSAGSGTIKGFYSDNNAADLIPYVTVIYTKNKTKDTVTLNISESVSLSDAPASINPTQETFILQNGIAYRNVLNFDLTKLPPNVIINNASLEFTLDNTKSFISPSTDKRIIVGMMIDSTTKSDSLFTEVFLSDSNTYILSSTAFNSMVQRWNSGILPNLGLTMKNYYEIQNLDNFYIYSPSASDISLRPRLKITYTPRD